MKNYTIIKCTEYRFIGHVLKKDDKYVYIENVRYSISRQIEFNDVIILNLNNLIVHIKAE